MAVRPAPSLSEEIARGISRVRRRLIAEADRRLGQRGETVLAFQVLSALQCRGRAAQNELAEHIGQHPTGVSRLLEELEQAGLVRRARDRSDRRKILVEPTARGRAFLEQGRPLVDAAVEEVLAPLARAERRTLRDLLWRMLDGADS
jgi:MarR family transcriptional regulator, lower aerobic nicotinate degradation pathway regulator